jgi:nitrous oxide reductase
MFTEITLNRRRFLGTAAMVMAAPQLAMIGCVKEQSSKAGSAGATTRLGSVSRAPNLPAGFTDTFTSRYIGTGELRLHAVIPDAGHWVAEEAPEEMLAALTEFLAPYREGGGGLR